MTRSVTEGPPAAYFQLFLDPELHHSSGYFMVGSESLAEAQRNKTDAILDHCQLQPSMTLLDVGCGWGATVRAAHKERGVRVIGLTVTPEHYRYAAQRPGLNGAIRLQSWEDFHEPVDRIVCVNAFENFADQAAFLPHCRSLLPAGGRVVMLTVTADRPVFRAPPLDQIVHSGQTAGFTVTVSESLAAHYARTLDCFVRGLTGSRAAALRLVDTAQIEHSLRFYSTSAELLRRGRNDMYELTFEAR
jgi:cyclopropane-fatty-acyl-phospholipid synthase